MGAMTGPGFKHMHFSMEQILNEAGLSLYSEHRFFAHTPNVLRHRIKFTQSGKKCAFLRRELRRVETYLAVVNAAHAKEPK